MGVAGMLMMKSSGSGTDTDTGAEAEVGGEVRDSVLECGGREDGKCGGDVLDGLSVVLRILEFEIGIRDRLRGCGAGGGGDVD